MPSQSTQPAPTAMNGTRQTTPQPRAPELWRLLIAMVYDSLLVVSILIVASAIVVVPFGLITGAAIPGNHPLFRLWLATAVAAFFLWFWVHGGQTLGMRAWRMRVVRMDGQSLRWRDAIARLLASLLSWAACGLGFAWILVGPQHRTWHDRLAGTRLVMVKKNRS